jgi:hypothetical protein
MIDKLLLAAAVLSVVVLIIATIGNIVGRNRCDTAGGVYVDGKCLAVAQIKIWED